LKISVGTEKQQKKKKNQRTNKPKNNLCRFKTTVKNKAPTTLKLGEKDHPPLKTSQGGTKKTTLTLKAKGRHQHREGKA